MSLYSQIDKHILIPSADMLMHRGISKEWRLMERMDNATEKELIALQNRRLQTLIQHCYINVPYYTRVFSERGLKPEDIQCREDLQKLPVLTKQIIRDHYDELISRDITSRHIQKCSTGGSTGKPLQFLRDMPTWNMTWASSYRAWEWYGFHVGERLMTLGGNSLVKKRELFTTKDIFDLCIMRNMKRSSAEVDEVAMQAHYEAYMAYKPQAMRGYASSLVILARYIAKKSLPIWQMKCILTTGEILMPEYKKTLQEVFHCSVYDEYGAGDGGVNAHECSLQAGLHISEETCIIEITDKEGRILPDGKIGYVTSTDLGNYAFPFIRYQVGDMAYIKPEKCTCGRASRVIGQVIGRAGKLLYNKQGVPISPTMLPIMLYRDNDYHNEANCVIYNKIDQFQIRQDKQGDIRILLKLKDPNEAHEQFEYCIENFRKHFVGSKVSLEFVDSIPPMPSGKEDYCISEYEYTK